MSDLTLSEVREDFLRGIQAAGLREVMGAQFDGLIARIRAETLREAAERLRKDDTDPWGRHFYPDDLDSLADELSNVVRPGGE